MKKEEIEENEAEENNSKHKLTVTYKKNSEYISSRYIEGCDKEKIKEYIKEELDSLNKNCKDKKWKAVKYICK